MCIYTKCISVWTSDITSPQQPHYYRMTVNSTQTLIFLSFILSFQIKWCRFPNIVLIFPNNRSLAFYINFIINESKHAAKSFRWDHVKSVDDIDNLKYFKSWTGYIYLIRSFLSQQCFVFHYWVFSLPRFCVCLFKSIMKFSILVEAIMNSI